MCVASLYTNSKELVHNLKRINVQMNTKIYSFDITNMYTNIPQNELIQIIRNTLDHNNTPESKKEEHATHGPTIKTERGVGNGSPHICNTS
jgi:hypothetical protein